MDINKGKLIYIKDKSLYNSNNFLDTLVIFVEDTKEIITHGISFAGIPSSYSMYVGAKDKKANATTTNGNTYIKLYKDSTLNNQFLIKGTGATTVVSDASGNITINSTDSNTWRALQVKGTQIAGTGTGTYPVNFVEGTDITLTGTVGTSTTKLNSITINHADITTTVTAAKDTATQLAYSGEITVPTAITTNNGHITAYTWTKYKLPAASHYTTKIYAGTSGTNANSTNDVSNPYLTVVDNTTYRNQVQFAGSGATSVKAKNGVITISSTNTWTAFVGAKTNAAGTAGYVPAPSSGLTGLYFRSDGTWATPTDTKYTLPTASNSTLGGVKTGAAIDSTSGYTAVHINNGVIYYKNTTYSTKAMKVNGSTYNVYTSSTSLPTIYAPTAVGTAGQVLATNSNADGLEWKSVATTTKAMKVNGTNYNIYTTGTSLPTIYAPTSLGTAGQVLKMNGDGTGFTWATDATIANTWRPVKALKSDGTALGTLSDNSTTLSLKAGSNITLAYSSGTITITGVGNTWTALGGATASADGVAGYAPKPTKGQQGYYLKGNATWVKPSLSEFTDDVIAGNYLPLSGGQIEGTTTEPLFINTSSENNCVGLSFKRNNTKVGHVGYYDKTGIRLHEESSLNGLSVKDGIPYYYLNSGTTLYKLWHENNFNPSEYLPLTGGDINGNLSARLYSVTQNLLSGASSYTSSNPYTYTGTGIDSYKYLTGVTCTLEAGCSYLVMCDSNYNWCSHDRQGETGYVSFWLRSNVDTSIHVLCSTYVNGSKKGCWGIVAPLSGSYHVRLNTYISGDTPQFYNMRIYKVPVGISPYMVGIAHKAEVLLNSRNIWGQSFDGTSDISGDLSGVGSIIRTAAGAVNSDASGNLVWKSDATNSNSFNIMTNSSTRQFTVLKSGNVGIGYSNPSYKFLVNGTGCFDGALTINHNTTDSGIPGLVLNRNTSGDTLKICNTSTSKSYIRGSISFPNLENNPGMGWHVFPENSQWTNSLGNTGSSYNISTGSVTFGSWNDTEMPLYVDITNKKIGVGTVSPLRRLHINGDATFNTLNSAAERGKLGPGMLSVGLAGQYGTHIWTSGSGTGYIQVGRLDGTDTTYSLHLQPHGGGIIVGGGATIYNRFDMRMDASLCIYGAHGSNQSYGTETVSIQTTFDDEDPLNSTLMTRYPERAVLSLLPKGGQVKINGNIAIHAGNIANYTTASSGSSYLSNTGFGSGTLTWKQTSESFYGSSWTNGWASYLINNHGDGSTYYNYVVAFPFWTYPYYKRMTGNTSSTAGWYYFVTQENIGSMSVNNSTKWGGYSISVSGTPSNSTITFYI